VTLRGFPRSTLREDRVIYRIHKSARAPWWFSANGDGRFDPIDTGFGACYLADAPLGAWVEVFRKRLLLAEPDVAARSLQAVALGRSLRLADVTSRRALEFGITASVGANERYEESQSLATQALNAGYGGIRYFVSHDPAQTLRGIALFAAAGQPDEEDPLWPSETGPIPPSLVREANELFGYRVLPEP
jgi:hypothetical protein